MKENINFLDILQVKKMTGFKSTTSIYTLIREENFPEPVRIGLRTKKWVESEVQDWMKFQIAKTRGLL